MGTYYRISYLPHKNSLLKPQDVKEKIEADLLELNRQMSTYKEDSEISSLNKNEADKELKISYVDENDEELGKSTGENLLLNLIFVSCLINFARKID